jgi:hypothetical protein
MITVDNKELRRGFIGNKETDPTPTNNRMLDIIISGSLPILAGEVIDRVTKLTASPIDGVNCFVENTNINEDDNYNVLTEVIDGAVTDRFKFLGKANSAIYSGLFIDLYYDKKYKDIIIIPDLRTFGIGENSDFYANDRRTVRGYSVGYGIQFNDMASTSFIFPLNLQDNDGIEEPNRLNKTRSTLVSLYGLESNSITSNTYIEKLSGPDGYFNHGVNTEKGAPIQLVELESNSIVFTDPETKVNTYNLLQQSHAELKVDFVGKRKISKIVIPISF